MSWPKNENLQHCLQNANNLMMLAESANINHTYSSPIVRRPDAAITSGQTSPNLIDEDERPMAIDTIHPTIEEADTRTMRNTPTPHQEIALKSNHCNNGSSSQQPAAKKFTWSIHVDKILMDYCSYFLNADGSIGDDKWAPIAHELGTSAASCRMRWHVLKGSATRETWEQQQQYVWQHLRLSVHQQGHQPSVQPAQPTNDKPPARTFQTLHSSSAAPTQQHHRQETEYFNADFDAYLQRVLWEDEDFVRAVDEIYQEEKAFNLFESP